MIRLVPLYGKQGVWMSVFHSVSAFCNGGFDLMGQHTGPYSSLTGFVDDWLVNMVIMALIVIGGVGFVVWDDMLTHKWKIRRYHLHSKIVLFMTGLLIFGGAILFLLIERNATGAGLSFGDQILAALFDSVTARTAGFNTVDTAALSDAGKLLTIALMFIGGSWFHSRRREDHNHYGADVIFLFLYEKKPRHLRVWKEPGRGCAAKGQCGIFYQSDAGTGGHHCDQRNSVPANAGFNV